MSNPYALWIWLMANCTVHPPLTSLAIVYQTTSLCQYFSFIRWLAFFSTVVNCFVGFLPLIPNLYSYQRHWRVWGLLLSVTGVVSTSSSNWCCCVSWPESKIPQLDALCLTKAPWIVPPKVQILLLSTLNWGEVKLCNSEIDAKWFYWLCVQACLSIFIWTRIVCPTLLPIPVTPLPPAVTTPEVSVLTS